jgi:hypothetical protein
MFLHGCLGINKLKVFIENIIFPAEIFYNFLINSSIIKNPGSGSRSTLTSFMNYFLLNAKKYKNIHYMYIYNRILYHTSSFVSLKRNETE